MAEVVDGISLNEAISTGKKYKQGSITAIEKNKVVLTGKDKLFESYRRVIDNYISGYALPQPPNPPKKFVVTSGGDRISLSWEPGDSPDVASYKIYRLKGRYNDQLSGPELIYTAKSGETSYDDLSPVRGVAYYYYIQAVGTNGLSSSRYATQTYDPAFLKRTQGQNLNDIRVVPNPYIITATQDRLLFPGQDNKIAFFNVPGQCKIKIYTEVGELVKTIEHRDGSGDEYWNLRTASNQVVVSGVYIAYIEVTEDIVDQSSGKKLYSKGQVRTLKFVIVR